VCVFVWEEVPWCSQKLVFILRSEGMSTGKGWKRPDLHRWVDLLKTSSQGFLLRSLGAGGRGGGCCPAVHPGDAAQTCVHRRDQHLWSAGHLLGSSMVGADPWWLWVKGVTGLLSTQSLCLSLDSAQFIPGPIVCPYGL
jgi:hypothetical protein